MKLSSEEQAILNGAKGPVMQKVIKTLVLFGEAIEADCLVDIDVGGHFSCPTPTPGVGLRMEMLKEWVDTGLKTTFPFTMDPKGPENLNQYKLTEEQESEFRSMHADQPAYDDYMKALGLRDEDCYTCTPYFPEIGNIPGKDMVLAWSESSCIIFANSVLGARTHRNAAIIDLISNIAGKTPMAGFLTEDGRKANWLVELQISSLPTAQVLGALIGSKVFEGVPYICGLDRYLNSELDPFTIDYLKELGAACAAVGGAVGLFHIHGVTPEAVQSGKDLLQSNHSTYIITDEMLKTKYQSYPVIWKNPSAQPQRCLIGCPHVSLRELYWWEENINAGLSRLKQKKIKVNTVICAAVQIIDKFKSDDAAYQRLNAAGVKLDIACPEAIMNNPYFASEPVVTNSNKLRNYSTARLFNDLDLLEIILTGRIKGGWDD